jgi:capsular polysaccharide transport system permease protein
MKQLTRITLFRRESQALVGRLRVLVSPGAGQTVDRTSSRPPWSRFPRHWLRRYWSFLLFVVLPTLLTSTYYVFIAADQYVSEARFIVRGSQPTVSRSILGQIFGVSGLQTAGEETSGVDDFLVSHDAVSALKQRLDLVGMFRRPGVDFLSRLEKDPTAEELLKYYRGQVKVALNTSTGITSLTVYAFRASDARQIAENLLQLGEQLVNQFSERAEADTLRVAQAEVNRAEARVAAIRERLTEFRDQQQAIDPTKSTAMVLGVMGKLEEQLAQARAEQTAQRSYLKPDNPKLLELDNRIAALESQIAQQRARLTGSDGALAPVLAGYEGLMLEREFADRDYTSALASLEAARIDAEKQHLYLIRVVEPNEAEEALYPRRAVIILTVFLSLLVAYGIGWLIVAGVREHAA